MKILGLNAFHDASAAVDGMPGLVYCALQSTHFFHIKAKMYELKHTARSAM